MSDKDRIEAAKRNNAAVFMERGLGLDARYQTWIAARDRARNRVLLGGLGAMGVGQMWVEERDSHREYPGYDDAPEEDSWMGFGAPESLSAPGNQTATAVENMRREAERLRKPLK
jgi:hypothetical protein